MIQLNKKEIDSELQRVLAELQAKIDRIVSFADKTAHAQVLWKSKGGATGIAAFSKIRDELYNLCVNEGICNYCEQNEANDIEHIYPKSFFPKYTFSWNNFLLACKQCNSAYKLDKCYCIKDDNSVCKVERGNEPDTQNIALINPRIEDPNRFMILNLRTFTFEILPDLTLCDTEKAKYTLKILCLDTRDTLLVARRSALRHYFDMLQRLCRILDSNNLEELKLNLSPAEDRFDYNRSIEEIKSEVFKSYKKYITTYQHPSVWYSIKVVESKISEQWKTLFDKIPDALSW